MDKEVQGKIAQFLGIAQEIGKKGAYLDVWGNARALLNSLQQLGYRKLPKDKPPLLSDEEIERAVFRISKGTDVEPHLPKYHQITQAQRETDIKHYED